MMLINYRLNITHYFILKKSYQSNLKCGTNVSSKICFLFLLQKNLYKKQVFTYCYGSTMQKIMQNIYDTFYPKRDISLKFEIRYDCKLNYFLILKSLSARQVFTIVMGNQYTNIEEKIICSYNFLSKKEIFVGRYECCFLHVLSHTDKHWGWYYYCRQSFNASYSSCPGHTNL